jgi:dolichyl-phosphate beta-glucosyltransferase
MESISIIIPCYNEENNLKKGVLEEVAKFLNKQKFNWEVLICNDGSTDNSLKIVQDFSKNNFKFRVLDLKHGGKPSAVWGGIKEAKYDLVLFTDMDQSTPIKEISKLIPWSNQGYDIVIGSRGFKREGYSLVRKIGGPIFLFFRRMVFLHNIIDTQCGFKMFKTDVAKQLFPHLQFFKDKSSKKGWRVSAFDVELLFMAQKLNYKIKEVTVEWKNEDISTTKGDSGAKYRQESIQMIKEMVRVMKNNIQGNYDQDKLKNNFI